MLSLSGVQKVDNYSHINDRTMNDEAYVVEKGEFISIMGDPDAIKLMIMNNLGLIDKVSSFNAFEGETRSTSRRKNAININKRNNIGIAKKPGKLLLHLSALENVMFPMAYYKTGYNLKDRAVTLLNMVGLKDMMDYRPYQLTIEEQIRVSIAQALIDSPEFLIIDDLFEKIDSALLENILELLKEINEKGQTILFITNNFESGSNVGTVVYFKKINMKSNMMSFEL